MYILTTGCQWRAIPKDLPPKSTLFDYLDLWSWDGTLRIHQELYEACREQGEREASPTAAIIDSQSVKSAEKRGRISIRMANAGKKVKGKKRHILVDTLGLLLSAAVHSADIQDRDGAALVPDERTRALFPLVMRIFADAGWGRARQWLLRAPAVGSSKWSSAPNRTRSPSYRKDGSSSAQLRG